MACLSVVEEMGLLVVGPQDPVVGNLGTMTSLVGEADLVEDVLVLREVSKTSDEERASTTDVLEAELGGETNHCGGVMGREALLLPQWVRYGGTVDLTCIWVEAKGWVGESDGGRDRVDVAELVHGGGAGVDRVVLRGWYGAVADGDGLEHASTPSLALASNAADTLGAWLALPTSSEEFHGAVLRCRYSLITSDPVGVSQSSIAVFEGHCCTLALGADCTVLVTEDGVERQLLCSIGNIGELEPERLAHVVDFIVWVRSRLCEGRVHDERRVHLA